MRQISYIPYLITALSRAPMSASNGNVSLIFTATFVESKKDGQNVLPKREKRDDGYHGECVCV